MSRLKLSWKTTTVFPDLVSGDECFCEAPNLETALKTAFKHAVSNILATCNLEDAFCQEASVVVKLERFPDGTGVDFTPRSLFEFMPEDQKKELKKRRKKKGKVDNGEG